MVPHGRQGNGCPLQLLPLQQVHHFRGRDHAVRLPNPVHFEVVPRRLELLVVAGVDREVVDGVHRQAPLLGEVPLHHSAQHGLGGLGRRDEWDEARMGLLSIADPARAGGGEHWHGRGGAILLMPSVPVHELTGDLQQRHVLGPDCVHDNRYPEAGLQDPRQLLKGLHEGAAEVGGNRGTGLWGHTGHQLPGPLAALLHLLVLCELLVDLLNALLLHKNGLGGCDAARARKAVVQ
mmetsp:Transcript_142852/g.249152  ORF Transcript_142852/g.249152 Transcript_142852/m.249152 type:complete len:235 (+) Transcript_142852:404-1108(+)